LPTPSVTKAHMKVNSIGEFALIDRIRAKVPSAGDRLLVGIGDDSAAIEPTAGCVTLAATDMLIEGVHFDLRWHDLVNLGRKSLNVNISDILVMGGVPLYALLSLAIPPSISVEALDELFTGFNEVCAEHGIILTGGDTSSSPHGLMISVALLGETGPSSIIRRSGASPGDAVFVTGTLGNSAAGLKLLQSGNRLPADSDHLFLTQRHLNPRPRRDAVTVLVAEALATSMIDISDGLSSELNHLARSSGVGMRVQANSLPSSPALKRFAESTGTSLSDLTLHGGEEYEVLFTTNPQKSAQARQLISQGKLDATEIGLVYDGSGVMLEQQDGSETALEPRGFEHFSV